MPLLGGYIKFGIYGESYHITTITILIVEQKFKFLIGRGVDWQLLKKGDFRAPFISNAA